MHSEIGPSTIARTRECLQVFLNLPEILAKFEGEDTMRRYAGIVTSILSNEIDFVLKSWLTRDRGDVPDAARARGRKDHRSKSVHIQGEFQVDIQSAQ